MTTNATNSRTITADLPDYGSDIVEFQLLSSIAIGGTEVFPGKVYTMQLEADGTDDGTFTLPMPDATGTLAWAWEIRLPDGSRWYVTIAYDASSIDLSTILAAAVSSATPNDLTALLAAYLPLAGGTMTGALLDLLDTPITQTLTGQSGTIEIDLTTYRLIDLGYGAGGAITVNLVAAANDTDSGVLILRDDGAGASVTFGTPITFADTATTPTIATADGVSIVSFLSDSTTTGSWLASYVGTWT